MKNIVTATLAIAGIGMLATPAVADRPGGDWIAAGKVKQILAKRGYRVTKVDADDGHWEGEASRRGQNYEFHVDPHSGAITKLERDRD